MKKYLVIATVFGSLLLWGCKQNPQAVIEGNITEATGKTLYLDALNVDKLSVVDSVKLKDDGKFLFKVPKPECYDFYRLRVEREMVNISIDSTETVRVEAALPVMSIAYKVSGSEDNEKLKDLVLQQIELQNKVMGMIRASGPETGVTRMKIREAVQQYKDSVRMKYIYANPLKPYAYFALFQRLGGELIFDPMNNRDDVKAFAAVATSLDTFYPEATRTRNLHNIAIKGMSNTRPARPSDYSKLEDKIVEASIIDIDLMDADGAQHKLSDLKGKVVLLSFCAYAQETSAVSVLTLRELYNEYAEQGFEIYQVSLDENEHYWRMAVNNLPWVCVRDAETNWFVTRDGAILFKSPVASLYGVTTLPTYFIVNRDNELVLRIEDEKTLVESVQAAMKGK